MRGAQSAVFSAPPAAGRDMIVRRVRGKERGGVGEDAGVRSPFALLGGAFRGEPEDVPARLGPAARELVERAFDGLGPGPLVDCHAHIVGLGCGGSGARVDPALLSWLHPVRRVKGGVFLSASGTAGLGDFDQRYAARLARLARGFGGRTVRVRILALDGAYRPDGTPIPGEPEFTVPNEHIVRLAAEHPDVFVPVVSVHPDRPDAPEELARWADRGVRTVKWLPVAQRIDPGQARHGAFYEAMRRRGLTLLCHAGEERAVTSRGAGALGNPLLLRRPLDLGVKAIVAHCACAGRYEDLDRPGRGQVSGLDLFLRLMAEEKYRGRLFGDISAMTLVNRVPGPILEIIRRPELHDRLIQGSDYPLPAINCAVSTRQLARLGLVTRAERAALNEVYDCNPLLFDFVLKRTIRDPVTGGRLPAGIFQERKEL